MIKLQKKQILFAAIIIVVVGLSVTAAVLFSQYQASVRPDSDNKPATTSPKAVIEEKADDAMKQAYEGDVSGGAASLDEAIKNTTDNHEKSVYYSRKATLLYNSQDLAGALAAALQAYELEKSSDSAALVGQFSKESGNNAQAIEYYKKAIELIDKADPYSNEDVKYYNSIVKELGGN
jgi:tetratricopeptide (TPR) repeat protein